MSGLVVVSENGQGRYQQEVRAGQHRLIADEPTGNLDAESGTAILDIFADFHRVGVTVVVATHDQSWIERYHPNVLRLDHGRVAA